MKIRKTRCDALGWRSGQSHETVNLAPERATGVRIPPPAQVYKKYCVDSISFVRCTTAESLPQHKRIQNIVNDKILKGFDTGLLTGMILIDLQKAFDTIDHEILFQKMEYLCFSKQTIK